MDAKILALAAILIMAAGLVVWAPWLDDQELHDRVLREKAEKDGTVGWVTMPDGSTEYILICDYKVSWVPFGRWVASCEGGYFVTAWGQIVP
ncbi:MAG: hypothetical protein QFX34_01955 [Candidatus Verstraetearchaeota archaeon]|nr:hypothetical protein [Candidatus Verstraetearchaeota archaeon]